MKKIFILIGVSINVIAQSSVKQDTSCSFLKNIKFKNDKDTFIVKVTFQDVNPLPGYGYLNKLDKEKKLKKKDFNYQIVFKPENCSKEYIVPSGAKNINSVLKAHPDIFGMTGYVTCVAFRGYKYDYEGTPFFVIIKLEVN